jgi:hypothetical protein
MQETYRWIATGLKRFADLPILQVPVANICRLAEDVTVLRGTIPVGQTIAVLSLRSGLRNEAPEVLRRLHGLSHATHARYGAGKHRLDSRKSERMWLATIVDIPERC